MKSYFYTSIPTFFLLSIIVITSGITRATNDDSKWLAAEAQALMETGWWSNYKKRVGNHCMWPGIRCNAGSVVDIDLSGHGLNGSITPQIGALSKLRYLNLSWNILTLAYSLVVTEKCDVYSFGVLALEVLMGKHPGKLLSTLSSSSSSVQNFMLNEILDPRLSTPRSRKMAGDIVFIAVIAFACLRARPKAQPTMKLVSQEFLHIKSCNASS
ncbi:hypothetical protein GOBAR_AA35024 [Gossypium barbadense]|uniref:non-specific serine/threonine protein kinase n=1 Tax=Gossypium barbadense TaxID=3634 RepID=A0A2P5W3G9_GOSBA|nr:hypothetical protein GOBAR_AA35024 [Gossypium barbadense]